MAALFNFEVHTPYRLFYNGKAQAIVLELADGEIGVYAKHSAFIAPVVTCVLRIKDEKGKWHAAFISDGILEVKEYKNVLLVDTAEWPQEIDRERILTAIENAKEAIHSTHLKFKEDKAHAKLRRAQCRLKTLEYKPDT
jgi:F-type H+-transporting ATPase subunit epsilon